MTFNETLRYMQSQYCYENRANRLFVAGMRATSIRRQLVC
jgi:hypothetical protein